MLPAPRRRPPGFPALTVLLLIILACGEPGTSPTDPGPPGIPEPSVVLASGSFVLPAAIGANDAGNHEVVVLNLPVRPDLPPTAGDRLVLRLRDRTRPALVCTSDEPEDGCATVDWSAEPGQPRVPANGRFENRLRIELTSGTRVYYLSRTFRLADVIDVIDVGQRQTAVGGAPRAWDAVLPAEIVAGSNLQLRLVMTKWQPPSVEIAFEIGVD